MRMLALMGQGGAGCPIPVPQDLTCRRLSRDHAHGGTLALDAQPAHVNDLIRRPAPGSITPLGVRVDKGQGLLSSSSAAETLSDMVRGITTWADIHG